MQLFMALGFPCPFLNAEQNDLKLFLGGNIWYQTFMFTQSNIFHFSSLSLDAQKKGVCLLSLVSCDRNEMMMLKVDNCSVIKQMCCVCPLCVHNFTGKTNFYCHDSWVMLSHCVELGPKKSHYFLMQVYIPKIRNYFLHENSYSLDPIFNMY